MNNSMILYLCIISVALCTSRTTPQPNDLRQLSQKIFTPQHNQQYMSNMFLTYNQIVIKSRLYFLRNRKQITLASQQIELILQHDYWKMYKKKFSPILRFNVTNEVMNAIRQNNTYLETTVYVIIKQMKQQIDKQVIPLMRQFQHIGRQGMDNWVIADQELLEMLPEEQLLLTHYDIYFFLFDWQLPFNTKTKPTTYFSIYKDNDQTYYYYPKPLSKDITIKLKENYIPLSSINQDETVKIQTTIKLAGYLYPLVMFVKQRQEEFAEQGLYQFQGWSEEMIIDYRMGMFWPYLYRFVKKVALQGSILNWVIFIWSGIALLASSSAAILSFLFQYKIFKVAQQRRGMSLYGLILVFIMSIVNIISGLISESYDSTIVSMITAFFTCWKITKMAKVQFSQNLPFVNVTGYEWYKTYQQKDWTAFTMVFPFILFLIGLVTLYPLIFQNYLHYTGEFWFTQVINYLFYRLTLAIDQYLLVFTFIIQLILNYYLKTCNSLTWKYIITLMIYYSVDNSLILVTPSISDYLFWLKEDILLWILIFQKLTYGNNLQQMKILHKKQDNNESEGQQNQEQKTQQQQQMEENGGKIQEQNFSNLEKEVSQNEIVKVQDQKQKKE